MDEENKKFIEDLFKQFISSLDRIGNVLEKIENRMKAIEDITSEDLWQSR